MLEYSDGVNAVLDAARREAIELNTAIRTLPMPYGMCKPRLKALREGIAEIKVAVEKVAKLKHVLELLDKDAVYKTEEAEQRGDEEVEQFHSGRSHAAREALYWLDKEPEP